MYRIAFIVVTVLAISLGLLIGTLNSETVSVDLLWIQVEWPLGLLILAACVSGLFIGILLTWLFTILPLRAQLRRARGQADSSPTDSAKHNHA